MQERREAGAAGSNVLHKPVGERSMPRSCVLETEASKLPCCLLWTEAAGIAEQEDNMGCVA